VLPRPVGHLFSLGDSQEPLLPSHSESDPPVSEVILLHSKPPLDLAEEKRYLKPFLVQWLTLFYTRFNTENVGAQRGGVFFQGETPDYLWSDPTAHQQQPPGTRAAPRLRVSDQCSAQAPPVGRPLPHGPFTTSPNPAPSPPSQFPRPFQLQ
jgi:hypothetical protein